MPTPARTTKVSGAGGMALVADSWGDRSNPSIIFLHGGGQNRHSWRRTAQLVSESGWHTTAFDMRGHGDTGWSENRQYALSDYVEDLEAVARAVGQPAVLIGASLGGIVALLASTRAPNSASALVMVDVGLSVNPAGSQRVRSFMLGHAETGFDSLEEVADTVGGYLKNRDRVRTPEELRKSLIQRDGRWFWHWDPNILKSTGLSGAETGRLKQVAHKLNVPTLLIRGALSDVLDDERVAEFIENVPHALYRSVDDAAHMVAGDHNDAFNTVVCEFLEFIKR
ncbi:alpha/beta fold hydrolase [Aurantiacibacter atlanticus]|uniref:alpha/beta fold hydrolase n=1 Tax=Aurantiacibacter atlanticus TaxID=1648404 RepID=UPI00065F4C03|nr:alpha/beta hydrolase [Aurantiacibacter atlanticus]